MMSTVVLSILSTATHFSINKLTMCCFVESVKVKRTLRECINHNGKSGKVSGIRVTISY